MESKINKKERGAVSGSRPTWSCVDGRHWGLRRRDARESLESVPRSWNFKGWGAVIFARISKG